MMGELPYPRVLEQMQRSKLLLHPSSYEGFSGVCLEALYSGAHVISFCRAMDNEIAHWHIIQSKEEMSDKALKILQDTSSIYQSTVPFTISDTAKKMMDLFSG